jgi:phosphoglucosamine mutase
MRPGIRYNGNTGTLADPPCTGTDDADDKDSTMRKLFGTDGVRGLANQFLSPELALQLGRAAGLQFREAWEGEGRPCVLVGRDTRQSGEMLQAGLSAGFASAGIDVYDLGVVPTPAIAWLTANSPAIAGVVISASHNPAPDNGIKFLNAEGYKLADEVELAIEARLEHGDGGRPLGMGVGRLFRQTELALAYMDHAVTTAPIDLTGLRVVLDTAHGATSVLNPEVLRRLGVDVHVIADQPDGGNINDGCGSTHLEWVTGELERTGADLAIAFDGDGDRMLAVAPGGHVLDGDQILYLCRAYLPSLQGETDVVATVMSNMGLEAGLQEVGVTLHRAKVGDRYVLETMQKLGAKLGGEQSGHVIFGHLQTTGDGLISAIQLLAAIKLAGRPVQELMLERFPQVLVNVRVQHPARWTEVPAITEAIDRTCAVLGNQGRVLVRASGTEPLVRVMLEGRDAATIQAMAQELAALIEAELNSPTPV